MSGLKGFMVEYIKKIPRKVWNERKKKNGMFSPLTKFDNLSIENYIVNEDLLNMQKAMKFIVEFNVEMIKATTDEFIGIKNEFHNDRKNLLSCVRDNLKVAIDNPNNCEHEVNEAESNLIKLANSLNSEIERDIQLIKDIEALDKRIYFLRSIINLRKSDRAIELLIQNSEALCKAYELYFVLNEYTNKDLSSIKDTIKGFVGKFLCDDTTFLLASYCRTDEQKEYFHELAEIIGRLDEQRTPINEIMKEYKKQQYEGSQFWDEKVEDWEEYVFL